MELGVWSKKNGFTPLEKAADFNRVRKISNSLTGFTLIEVMTAVVVMAIIMIPIALIALEQVRSAGRSDIVTIASNLAQKELGFVNTLSYTSPLIADGYDSTSANYAGYKYDVRRTVNYVSGTGNNLKRVRIRVYPAGAPQQPEQQLAEVDTFAMAVTFGAGSGGGASGNEKDALSVSGGSLEKDKLKNVTLTNTRQTGNITLAKVIIRPTIAKKLSRISISNGVDTDIVYSSSPAKELPANTDTTITLDKNYFMNYNISNVALFDFNNTNTTHTITVSFVFYDTTQSSGTSWTYTKP